jgi:hypothetical protein
LTARYYNTCCAPAIAKFPSEENPRFDRYATSSSSSSIQCQIHRFLVVFTHGSSSLSSRRPEESSILHFNAFSSLSRLLSHQEKIFTCREKAVTSSNPSRNPSSSSSIHQASIHRVFIPQYPRSRSSCTRLSFRFRSRYRQLVAFTRIVACCGPCVKRSPYHSAIVKVIDPACQVSCLFSSLDSSTLDS